MPDTVRGLGIFSSLVNTRCSTTTAAIGLKAAHKELPTPATVEAPTCMMIEVVSVSIDMMKASAKLASVSMRYRLPVVTRADVASSFLNIAANTAHSNMKPTTTSASWQTSDRTDSTRKMKPQTQLASA